MKKLLAIVVLGLFLTSCTQNSKGEYYCKNIMEKKYEDVTLEISKDKVKVQYIDGSGYTYSILQEKSDRIVFGYESMGENQMKQTFFKKTMKFKWESSYKKTKNKFMVIRDCQKLN